MHLSRLIAPALLAAALPALAHGPQMQVVIANNKLVTAALFPEQEYQAQTLAQRLYSIPLAQRALADVNDGWYAQPNAAYPFTGPGLALLDGQHAAGSKLTVTFADGLKRWNGSAFVDPGAEQLAISTSSAWTTSVVSKDAGPFTSITPSAVTGAHDEHKTLRWRLLGDGVSPNAASDDGVYLVSLQLSTDQPGVAPSDPYYFLLSKNASAGEFSAAQSAALTFAPEPGTLGVAALLATAALSRRRRSPQ